MMDERACGAGMVAQAVAVSSRALGGCGCASLLQASKENFNLKIDFRSLVPVSIITLRSLAMSSDMVSRPCGSVGSRMNADPTVAGSNPVAPCLITF